MKQKLIIFLIFVGFLSYAQDPTVVRGFSIAAPKPDRMNQFVKFLKEELGPNDINTLVLRVDYNYSYTSYPNLREEDPLSQKDVNRLVNAAKAEDIKIIPQINLLGHQSWASKASKLLEEYPEFDETPHIQLPKEYEWPNADSLYCKSYCPLHPEVHKVVFALVDEITEAFEADAFHAGMDEVFYLANEKCPRCSGKNRAKLFADEVTRIRDHLASNGQELWIWGDRLIDGKSTGLGMWEASENSTHPAVDLIPKDVVICDWHYENAAPIPAYFAAKGFNVISCFWNKPKVATAHMELMGLMKENSPQPMKSRLMGTMQTVWSPAGTFLDAYYGKSENEGAKAQAASFKAMIDWGVSDK